MYRKYSKLYITYNLYRIMGKQWVFNISEDLDRRMREAIGIRKGARQGVIKEAIEEAFEAWIKTHS